MTQRIKSPGQLLAALPVVIGATPHESLVLAGISGRGYLAPVARIDLAACTSRESARAVARECTGLMARAGAHSIVLVAFSEAQIADAALGWVRDGLQGSFDVTDTWVVAHGRYRSPDCTDLACCPRAGRALPPAPSIAGRGRGRVGMDVAAHEALPPVPRALRKPARDAFRRAEAAADAGTAPWRRKMLETWRTVLSAAAGGEVPRSAAIGRLAAGMADLYVRDALVIDLVPGEQETADRLCEGDDSGVRDALARLIGAEHPAHPPLHALTTTVEVAERIAWVCPEAAAPAYALIAIAQWWCGDLEAAGAAVATSLAAEPGYRLAGLIAAALEVDMPPGWLRVA